MTIKAWMHPIRYWRLVTTPTCDRGFFHGATCRGSSSDFDLCDACSARVQRFIEEHPREKAMNEV